MADAAGYRLLVLDDDLDVRATVAAMARAAGYATLTTADSEDFLLRLDDFRPSHVLIDLKLTGMDGVGIIQRMARSRSAVAVIIMSGLGDRVLEAAARSALEVGIHVQGMLSKPFTSRRFREVLRNDLAALVHPADSNGHVNLPRSFEVNRSTLAAAIEAGQIGVMYQPKVSCASGELVGFEALARWQHHQAGLIMPDQFIHIAEQSELIDPLSRQVVSQSLNWFAANYRNTPLKLAINFSARLLAAADFPDWVCEQCAQLAMPPSQLIMELTETSTMSDPVSMLQLLTQVRIKGFGLSIDDFGVGYSSLVHLARLPFSELKIDRMFMTSCRVSEESRKISTAIVGLAHALGMKVTAEGVEDDWTMQFLRGIHCDAAQGYLFAAALDGDAACAWRPGTVGVIEERR